MTLTLNQQPAPAGAVKRSRLDATEDVRPGASEVSVLFGRPVTLNTYNKCQAASTAKWLKPQTDAPAHNRNLNAKNASGDRNARMGKGQVSQLAIPFGVPLTKRQEMQQPREPGERQQWLCDSEWHPILTRRD